MLEVVLIACTKIWCKSVERWCHHSTIPILPIIILWKTKRCFAVMNWSSGSLVYSILRSRLLAEVSVQIPTRATCEPLSGSYQLRMLHRSDIICALLGFRANKLYPFSISMLVCSWPWIFSRLVFFCHSMFQSYLRNISHRRRVFSISNW